MTRAIRRLCEKAELRVAHNPQDDDHIVGFACFTKSELHYLYVKKDFRAELKAEHLLAGVPLDSYTFLGRYMQDALDGYQGAGWDAPAGQSRQWKGPKGWRFTPRITI
jgi:hypothetical protein